MTTVSLGRKKNLSKTINQASKVMEPGDKAIIHEGIYHEQIMGGKSGLPDNPITYEGVDRDKVILRGSVTVKDWKKVGAVWFKVGLKPITRQNLFVMVDEKYKLKQVEQPHGMPEGSFCLEATVIILSGSLETLIQTLIMSWMFMNWISVSTQALGGAELPKNT